MCVFPGLVKPATISALSSVKPGPGATPRGRGHWQLCWEPRGRGGGGLGGREREKDRRQRQTQLPCADPGVRVGNEEECDASASSLVSPSKLASTFIPRKSAASQRAGRGGSSQLSVERHQMVCYETHFGQKRAGVFGSWEDNKARKKGGMSRERQLWHQIWFYSAVHPFHTRGLSPL